VVLDSIPTEGSEPLSLIIIVLKMGDFYSITKLTNFYLTKNNQLSSSNYAKKMRAMKQ
jgi:hypothetical protein